MVVFRRRSGRQYGWRAARHGTARDDFDSVPLTFGMKPVGAILMLAGVMYGAQYGGAICSICSICHATRPMR